MQQLIALIERHKAGEPVGVFSLCSAHPWVIRAAMAQAVRRGEPVLIEATSNQVNQFGGYTGMTPAQFRDAVWRQADECGLPRQRVWLGAITLALTLGRIGRRRQQWPWPRH
ncbi:D-tagatose-1,6-bisphosphate aldolase subunit GatZ [Sodalis praecaptivus]